MRHHFCHVSSLPHVSQWYPVNDPRFYGFQFLLTVTYLIQYACFDRSRANSVHTNMTRRQFNGGYFCYSFANIILEMIKWGKDHQKRIKGR
jgi:hypothetical protein